jgi:hypothetical protein
VALAKSVTAVAIAKGAAASGSTLTLIKGALKIMAWTKMKTAIVTGAVIICAIGGGAGFYVYHTTHADAAGELRAALNVKKPATGTWSYPSEKVERAMLDFGSNRANAFPILEEEIESSNLEARKQAVSALWFVGAPFRPERAKYGLIGEPSLKVVPLLWQILNSDDGELSSFALTTLRGIGFEPENIPVLAALLVKSHGDSLSQKAMANASVAKMQNFLDRANNDQQLQRYIPEAIAETIRKNPEAAAPFISSVEDLLDNSNAGIRFGAACGLAEYKGIDDSKISTELKGGLKIKYDTSGPLGKPRLSADDGLKQLMTIETLQRVGTNATSMIPALLEFARSKNLDDNLLRELAFRAVGHINSNLGNTIPEVDQALKDDPNLKNSTSPQ